MDAVLRTVGVEAMGVGVVAELSSKLLGESLSEGLLSLLACDTDTRRAVINLKTLGPPRGTLAIMAKDFARLLRHTGAQVGGSKLMVGNTCKYFRKHADTIF